MVSYPFQMVQGLLIFSFTFMQILDVIWPMTRRHTLCGICSQSHGVARFRLNLEAFQMSADKVVETIGSTAKLKKKKYRLFWLWMQVCVGDWWTHTNNQRYKKCMCNPRGVTWQIEEVNNPATHDGNILRGLVLTRQWTSHLEDQPLGEITALPHLRSLFEQPLYQTLCQNRT